MFPWMLSCTWQGQKQGQRPGGQLGSKWATQGVCSVPWAGSLRNQEKPSLRNEDRHTQYSTAAPTELMKKTEKPKHRAPRTRQSNVPQTTQHVAGRRAPTQPTPLPSTSGQSRAAEQSCCYEKGRGLR